MTASVVLASTTRYLDISAALRWFRLPALLVAVMEMMYRYVFLLGAEARRMLVARRSRSAALPGLSSGGTLPWRGEGDGPDGRFSIRQDSEQGGASAHGYGVTRLRRRNVGCDDAKVDLGRNGDVHRDHRGPCRRRGCRKGGVKWQKGT